MPRARVHPLFPALVLLLSAALAGVARAEPNPAPAPAEVPPEYAPSVEALIDDADDTVHLTRGYDGSYRFIVHTGEGDAELTPEQFADRVYHSRAASSWVLQVFNISSPLGVIWVGVGLLGQMLFTGRMVVQWLASEKSRKSVVPTAFWWMSVIGAAMLLAYFIWRKDIVGILGQATGFGIYVRNLYFIYKKPVVPPIID